MNSDKPTIRITRTMRTRASIIEAGRKLFSAKPNAGLPEVIAGKIVYSLTPEHMATQMRTLLDLGVNILGGCCGSTPEHIRRLAEMVRGEESAA